MQKTVMAYVSFLLLPGFLAAGRVARADGTAGVSIGPGGVQGFYFAIGEHFKVPEKEILVIKEKHIPDEEIPIVFYLARRATVAPDAVLKLRLEGKSWMAITAHFRLSAEIFYVPAIHVDGPPYGHAYGHFKKKKREEWRTIELADAEIVNLVNLKFISEHHGLSPDEIIKMRQKEESFIKVNAQAKELKAKGKNFKGDEKNAKGEEKNHPIKEKSDPSETKKAPQQDKSGAFPPEKGKGMGKGKK